MNESGKKKRGLGALDWMILILVVFIAGSFVMRYMNLEDKGLLQNNTLGQYVVTVEIKDIQQDSANSYFDQKREFFFADTNTSFGTVLSSDPRSTSKYYELLDGTVQNIPMEKEEVKNLLRMDVKVDILVEGQVKNGSFYHGGTKVLGVNKELTIYSKFISVTAVVTDIKPYKESDYSQEDSDLDSEEEEQTDQTAEEAEMTPNP